MVLVGGVCCCCCGGYQEEGRYVLSFLGTKNRRTEFRRL